ncbi:PEP-CTERM sorting domain-containing protein [Luteolibacter sp. Populi]|uniref:PEP-CTERM sorting domain-containing protein n=1 Tax=Luteolibacter sp. Populi TaxID=3230487 RepID=UPI003467B893
MRSLLFCLFLACFLGAKSSAAVVLIIDITNLSQVKFTATSAFAQNAEADTDMLDGIVLVDIFSKNPGSNTPEEVTSSNLRSPGASVSFREFYDGGYAGGTLNLNFAGTNLSTHEFSPTEAAFTGSAVADFSGAVAGSLIAGTSGDIWAGSALDGRVVIGQFQIIPEPGSAMLGLAGIGMMVLRRRR